MVRSHSKRLKTQQRIWHAFLTGHTGHIGDTTCADTAFRVSQVPALSIVSIRMPCPRPTISHPTSHTHGIQDALESRPLLGIYQHTPNSECKHEHPKGMYVYTCDIVSPRIECDWLTRVLAGGLCLLHTLGEDNGRFHSNMRTTGPLQVEGMCWCQVDNTIRVLRIQLNNREKNDGLTCAS